MSATAGLLIVAVLACATTVTLVILIRPSSLGLSATAGKWFGFSVDMKRDPKDDKLGGGTPKELPRDVA